MRQVDREKFDALEVALVECAKTSKTWDGRKLMVPEYDVLRVMNAAVVALMSLPILIAWSFQFTSSL